MSPRWFWRLSNWQFVLAREISDIIIRPRENSRQQKRHYTHHPLNFHFCHLFSYYHHKILILLSAFPLRSTVFLLSTPSLPPSALIFLPLSNNLFRINMQEELLTGSTGKRDFSQDLYARGTFHRINMHEELLPGSTCKRNFSPDQHAPGTSHEINMHQELLTESTCKRTFWSANGCFSLDVKLYCLLSISPILLLSIFPFFHYCQLFSYYSILFTSVVNCLEPWIYAWLSLFQTMHDLSFKDLGRCLWLKWGDSKQHIHVPEMVLKTLQPTVCALKGYQWYHNKSEGKLKTAEETLHSSSP